MYDPPPTDHAWRRLAADVISDVTIDFAHDVNFVDIDFPNRQPVIPIRYESAWSGSWYNETYAMSGASSATFVFDTYTQTMSGSITMNGSLGGEIPISIVGSGAYNPVTDSSEMIIALPFQGTLFFVRGELTGTVTVPDYNLSIQYDGNYGSDQIMYTFAVTSSYTSNGWSVLSKQQVTDVTAERRNNGYDERADVKLIYPQPGTNYISILWNPDLGPIDRIIINGIIGDLYFPPIVQSQPGNAIVDINVLPNGVYGVLFEVKGRRMDALLLK